MGKIWKNMCQNLCRIFQEIPSQKIDATFFCIKPTKSYGKIFFDQKVRFAFSMLFNLAKMV